MGQLDYLNSYDWALQQGIINLCPRHDAYFDRRIGCPACYREQMVSQQNVEVTQISFTAFAGRLIVEGGDLNMGSKGRHNVKKPKQEKAKKQPPQDEKKAKK